MQDRIESIYAKIKAEGGEIQMGDKNPKKAPKKKSASSQGSAAPNSAKKK